MSDRRPPQPCDGCGQPTPDGWCDVCEFVAELRNLVPTLTADQVRDLRARVLAILPDTEVQP